jgi:Flp pilus assembly pilin Flp
MSGTGRLIEAMLWLRRVLDGLAADRGQTLTEYAVIIVWVALLVIVGAKTLGSSISHLLSSTATRV